MKKITCDEMLDLYNSALDGESYSEEFQVELVDHLERCPACAQIARELSSVHRLTLEVRSSQIAHPHSVAPTKRDPAHSLNPTPGDIKFWFCEGCGKRLTDRDIAAGNARDKKLKGVYCTDCAVGVVTMDSLTPLSEGEALKLLDREKRIAAQRQEQPPELEDSGARPQVHFGTGIHRFAQEKAAKAGLADPRPDLAPRERWRVDRPVWPILSAATVLVAVVLYIALRGSGLTKMSPPEVALNPQSNEALAEVRQAQEELARKEDTARQAREEAARKEAEHRQAQERLAEVERKKQELVARASERRPSVQEPQASPPAPETSSEAESTRRQEWARLKAQQKEEEVKVAAATAAEHEAAAEQARAEQARQAAEAQLAEARRKAQEIGRVVFVVEMKQESLVGGGAPSGPVLIRGTGAEATRTPLTQGALLLKGDRIETGKQGAGAKSTETKDPKAPRPVHAALELWSGAVVDLADETAFEIEDASATKLAQGLLFAKVTGDTSGLSEQGVAGHADLGKTGGFVCKTPYADVSTEAASLQLSADAKEAVVQVEDGGATFKNPSGETALKKLQKSVARKDYAPGPAMVIQASALWRGDIVPLGAGKNLLISGGFENGSGNWKVDTKAGTSLVVDGDRHSGAKALRITTDSDYAIFQEVKVKAGDAYEASGWVKTRVGDTLEGFKIEIDWQDSLGRHLEYELVGSVLGSKDWTRYHARVKAPDSAVRLLFYLRTCTVKPGGKQIASKTGWFDDCELSGPEK